MIVPARHLDHGWHIAYRMDDWEAFSLYGHDCGDTLAR